MSIVLKLTVARDRPLTRGFDHYWSVIMDHEMRGLTFTCRDILAFSNTKRSHIADFLRRLEKAGIIGRISETTVASEVAYRVLQRQSATPKVRRDGTVIEGASKQRCMWNAMRSSANRQGFTAQDISIWGSTDEISIGVETAKSYIKTLAKAGYLIEVMKGSPGKLGLHRLAPDMNTGPLPPMILRTKAVFDQNRHEIVGPVVTEEVQP